MVKLVEMEINIKSRIKMKATGEVRKVDELGRLVISKYVNTACKYFAWSVTDMNN